MSGKRIPRIYLDACIVLDWVGTNESPYIDAIEKVLDAIEYRRAQLVLSPVHFVEILPNHPEGNYDRFNKLASNPDILWVHFENVVAKSAQRIRDDHRMLRETNKEILLDARDTIHLASALEAECIEFITKDGQYGIEGGKSRKILGLGSLEGKNADMDILTPDQSQFAVVRPEQQPVLPER